MKEMAIGFMKWNMEEEEGGGGGRGGEEDIVKLSGTLLCLLTISKLGTSKT